MLANIDDIAMHLRCPKNGDALGYVDGHYRSEAGIEYPIASSQPVLVDFDRSVLDPAWVLNSDGASVFTRKASKTGALVKKYLLHGGADTVAMANANRFLAEASRFSSQPLVLIIGGGKRGIGTDPIYDSPQAKVVGFDVYASPLTHFIADGHRIPVADSLFDGVWIQYVMEHVLEPWVVAAEIARVLKPNGVVYSETPFLQQVHEGAYDFCRFTHSGHRWLFKGFEEIDSGIAMGIGPQVLWTIEHLARGISRSGKIGRAAKLLLFWLQYLDRIIPDYLRFNSASSFYFLGRKTGVVMHPKEIVPYYRGQRR